MYSESRGFYYEADLKGIAEAQENVRKAQLDKTVSELQRKITELQNSMKKETDQIDEQIKSLNELSEAWGEVSSTLEREIEDQRAIEIIGQNWEEDILNDRQRVLEDFTNAYVDLQRKQKDAYLEAAGAGNGNNKDYYKGNPDKDVYEPYNHERKYYYNGKTYSTVTEAEAAKQADVNAAYQKAYDEAMEKHRNDPIPDSAKKGLAEKAAREVANKVKNRQIKAAFGGTDSAKPGETLIGELGSEIVLHKNGTASVVDSPTLMNMKGGEKVFNAEETEKILKSKYVPLKKFNPKKFAMLHAFANGTSSPMQSMIAAQAVGIANGLNKGLIATSSMGGQTINQTFNVSLPNITDSSKATELFREFEQLQRKATQFFN